MTIFDMICRAYLLILPGAVAHCREDRAHRRENPWTNDLNTVLALKRVRSFHVVSVHSGVNKIVCL